MDPPNTKALAVRCLPFEPKQSRPERKSMQHSATGYQCSVLAAGRGCGCSRGQSLSDIPLIQLCVCTTTSILKIAIES